MRQPGSITRIQPIMHPFPHLYRASASGASVSAVMVASPSLPVIETAPPPEFDGPGGLWSPETLLCAAVADCFILTFRGISRAAQFSWLDLECRVEGTLERVGTQTQFTRYACFAKLTVPPGSDAAKAGSLLQRADHGCLIANSLRGTRTLEMEVLEEARE
jgi:organic hydroperoxide reductase OsmC/OhrA